MTIDGFLIEAPATADGVLDEVQRAVVALPDDVCAAVIGAPGTGKTTTAVEVIADRVLSRGVSPGQVLALTATRATAASLRDRIARRVGVPTDGPMARSVTSLAFDIVASAALAASAPPPRLLTGGDQDSDIAALIGGGIEDGTEDYWPEELSAEVRSTRTFRTELRELMMRATELGVGPARLRELGLVESRPEWVAAARFIAEYQSAISSAREDQLDSSELVQFAVRALRDDTVSESVDRLRLIVVDDMQEATASTTALLRAFVARGVTVIAFGDPDIATNAFRGAEADVLGRLGGVLGAPDLQTLFLRTVYRQTAPLRAVTSAVVSRIGTAGVVGHRSAIVADDATGDPDAVAAIHAASPARSYGAIARAFQRRHADGVAWNDMAVIVRSGARLPAIARALAAADIPTRSTAVGVALRDDRAARALMTVVDVGIRRRPLSGETACDLFLGPFGGLDRLGLRRLRLALRAEELAGGGTRAADELLVEALSAPGRLATIDHRVARKAAALAETLAAVSAAADATVEELFWLVWDRSSLAPSWFEQSQTTGIAAAEADRDLDGIVALFTAAKRFVEREPDAGPSVFLSRVLDAEVPDDTLSPQAMADAVVVTTPAAAVGREFDTVAVADLQDGVWPNLRIRGSLLAPHRLVRVLAGADDDAIDERKAVLSDELRMFALAVSRARRRLILAATVDDDDAASVFFALAPDAPFLDSSWQPPPTLRGMTGRLRRRLTSLNSDDEVRSQTASALARLAAEGVPGADPAQWHGLAEPSTIRPVFDDDETVPVSPSRLESFERSALDWFVESVSGTQTSTAMGIGTIVHWAMETAAEPTVEAVWTAVEERWDELVFESPWLSDQQKRATRALVVAVAEYLADFTRDGKTLVGAERQFAIEVGRARLAGAIDRVERSADGGVVIVDLKTGSAISEADVPEHAQLGAYQLAYASGELDDALAVHGEHHGAGAKLLYVKKGIRGKPYREMVQQPFDAEQVRAFHDRVTEAAEGMSAAAYTGLVEPEGYGSDIPRRRLHRVPAVCSD